MSFPSHKPSLLAAATLLATAAALTSALDAQAPRNHLVIAETNTTVDFRFVDPSNGNVTTVTEVANNWLGGAVSVSVDNSDPNGLYTSAGGSFGGAPLWRLEMTGSSWNFSTAIGAVMPDFGALGHVAHSPHGLLATLSSVSPGLYRAASITGAMSLVTALADAQDIAVVGDKVYVNSYLSGQPSTIIEHDFATNMTRTLGTGFPTVRALGTFGSLLLAGLDNGDIRIVDPVTNTMSTFLAPGLGSILAIAEGDNPGDTYFATAAGSVYNLANTVTPVYVSPAPNTLVDIDVSGHTLGQVRYGQGCPGMLGLPSMIDTGRAMPGGNYSFAMTGALPNAIAVLGLGLQRTAFDLGFLGWTGCTLLNEALVQLVTITDGAGNASIPLAIPTMASPYYFASVKGQYFVLENGLSSVASTIGYEVVVY